MAQTRTEYNQYLSEQSDPELVMAWGIIAACEEAQSKRLIEVDFTSVNNSPQIVPLKVVTYLTQKYQWTLAVDIVSPQVRRINKITLI